MATTETNIDNLRINYLTKEQYEATLSAGEVNENELYITPEEEGYTKSETDSLLSGKANSTHTHTIANVTDLQTTLGSKASVSHTHTYDSAMSSTSTNAVQNNVVNSALAGKVPDSRTVNGKPLSANISLTAADVGADASGAASSALTSAKSYTDGKIANLLDNSTEAVDSIMELAEAMQTNADAIETLNGIAGSKANASDLTSHTSNTTVHLTSAERTKWDNAATHAGVAHAPANAQANQNAFSNVTVGSTVVSADTATDNLTLAPGSNVSISADATNDTITISATDTKYTHPSATALASGLYKVTTSSQGHVTAGVPVTKEDITALGIPGSDTNTTYAPFKAATSSAAGGSGLVPAPAAGAQTKYLRADGTWQTPPDNNTTYGVMTAATSSAAGTSGLAPAPAAGAANRYLRSDGTWAVPPDTNTTYGVGSASALGLTKLYTGTGTATDGTMTQSAINTALSGKAASSHNHSASNITSGTLAIARGGTGVTTNAAIGLKAYPVGAVYISYVSTSPASLFGGTWTAITGRFPYFNAGTGTGGSNTHSLTSAQMPRHNHQVTGVVLTDAGSTVVANGAYYSFTQGIRGSNYTGGSATTQSAANGDSHNNMPAYQTLYAWRRTA